VRRCPLHRTLFYGCRSSDFVRLGRVFILFFVVFFVVLFVVRVFFLGVFVFRTFVLGILFVRLFFAV
jgi:hypothetical protein